MPTTIASALHFELRREKTSMHMTWIPALVHPENFRTTPFHFYSRHLSEEAPRKAWIKKPALVTPDHRNGVFEQAASFEQALGHALETLGNYEATISATSIADWTIHLTPVVVDVTVEDMEEILDGKQPAALFMRINRARGAAGFTGLFPSSTENQ